MAKVLTKSQIIQAIAADSSSTVPYASMRGALLRTFCPPTRRVSPLSPTFV